MKSLIEERVDARINSIKGIEASHDKPDSAGHSKQVYLSIANLLKYPISVFPELPPHHAALFTLVNAIKLGNEVRELLADDWPLSDNLQENQIFSQIQGIAAERVTKFLLNTAKSLITMRIESNVALIMKVNARQNRLQGLGAIDRAYLSIAELPEYNIEAFKEAISSFSPHVGYERLFIFTHATELENETQELLADDWQLFENLQGNQIFSMIQNTARKTVAELCQPFLQNSAKPQQDDQAPDFKVIPPI